MYMFVVLDVYVFSVGIHMFFYRENKMCFCLCGGVTIKLHSHTQNHW